MTAGKLQAGAIYSSETLRWVMRTWIALEVAAYSKLYYNADWCGNFVLKLSNECQVVGNCAVG